MTNGVIKSDKTNKQGPYDYDKHELRDGRYYDRVHTTIGPKFKSKYSDFGTNSDFKNYVTKQTLLQSRMSSAETDIPTNYYRKVMSGRKSSSIDSYYESYDNIDSNIGIHKQNFSVNKKESMLYQPETKYKSIKTTSIKKEKPQPKSMVQNGIKWELGDRYKFVDMVGSGSYGHVCRAYDAQLNKFVAIKRIHKVFDDLIDCKRILREIAILNRLDHPNVVKILDILVPNNLETFDVLYVVLEIAASDIKQLVRSPAFLNENHIRLLIFNLLSGVHYLHSVGIYHRDLKPANCLINRDCSVKICDFGLARTTTFPDEFIDNYSSRFESISSRTVDSGTNKHLDDQYNNNLSSNIINNYQNNINNISNTLNNFSTSRSLPDSFNNYSDNYKDSNNQYRSNYSDFSQLKDNNYSDNIKSNNWDNNNNNNISEQNNSNIENPKKIRQLTGHVVTRWYRAPELILLQENYSFAVDIWSVGCIFAELLNMMKVNVSEPSERSPLFPGSSCFPLSPDNKNSNSKNTRENDQLNLIFNILGTPSDEDINSIEKPDVRRYVKFFTKRNFQDLRIKFKGASLESLDLLKKMLTFNPDKRISVIEALNHPYFKSINKPRLNFSNIPKIVLPFNDWGNMSESQLRYSFLREIQRYHKDFKIPVKIIYRS